MPARTLYLLMLAGLLAGCAEAPPPTPAELLASGKAEVAVEDPVNWSLRTPPPIGIRVEITAVDGKNVCNGDRCPSAVTAPAGPVKLSILCLVVANGLSQPKGEGEVEGELIAGHVYGLHPLSVVPDCFMVLRGTASP